MSGRRGTRRGGPRPLLLTLALCVLGLLLAGPASAAHAGPGPSREPAYAGDFPDPSVLVTSSGYYAYATNSGGDNVQVRRSTDDGRTWRRHPDALPRLPRWAAPGLTWAPSVERRGDRYVMYYTARYRRAARQCISVATSTTPVGPFVDTSAKPLVCQLSRGGSIDPAPFRDADGVGYLLWKSDDNALGRRSVLWSQRLRDDGLGLLGAPVAVLRQDRPWEGYTMEGPTMVRVGKAYYLFYSSGWYDSANYAIGYAVCTSPRGGCRKVTTAGPWLRSRSLAAGPGGQSVFRDRSGRWRIAYHAWDPRKVGYRAGGVRQLWIDQLTFAAGRPVLGAAGREAATSSGPAPVVRARWRPGRAADAGRGLSWYARSGASGHSWSRATGRR